MKTEDNYFQGFPALWNLVAFYLFAIGADPIVGAAVVIALALLTFAPVHFVHPFRVRDYGPWLLVVTGIWAASTIALLAESWAPGVRTALLALSAGSAVLLIGMGLLRTLRGPRPHLGR
jgi:phosphatidylcholine synthase